MYLFLSQSIFSAISSDLVDWRLTGQEGDRQENSRVHQRCETSGQPQKPTQYFGRDVTPKLMVFFLQEQFELFQRDFVVLIRVVFLEHVVPGLKSNQFFNHNRLNESRVYQTHPVQLQADHLFVIDRVVFNRHFASSVGCFSARVASHNSIWPELINFRFERNKQITPTTRNYSKTKSRIPISFRLMGHLRKSA